MLQGIARLAIAAPRRIIAVALLVMVGAGMFGIPVSKSLSAGGLQDPTSESWQAAQLLSEKFGQGDMHMVIAVTSEAGAESLAARAVGADLVRQLQASPHVADVNSAWTASPPDVATMISKDGKTGLIVAGITGGEDGAQKHAKQLADQLVYDRNGVTVQASGDAMTRVQVNSQSEKDLLLMESIAMPLSFVVLVWVFGGVMAAALPLAVGGFAILTSMAVLRAITYATDVSIYALNLTVALSLALAIDYTLLIVSRFRDELAEGADRNRALVRTMATAGRTVLFSAMTVALSMVALMLFPMYFLKSFAYAGIAVVAFAAVAAVMVTPAAIVLLGDRLDSLDVRRLGRRLLRRPEPVRRPVEQMFFYRSTKFVMRHAIAIGLAIIALLLILGAPFLGIKWGFPDDRVLPDSASARQVGDQVRNDFAVDSAANVTVVIPDLTGVTPDELGRYAAQLSAGSGRVIGVCAGRHVRWRLAGRAAVGGSDQGRQRVFHGWQHRATVLRGFGDPVGPVARRHRSRRPTRTDDRNSADQPRQLRRDHLTAARRAGGDRRDHVRAAVLADRQRGVAAEGVAAQRLIAFRHLRCSGVDLPGRSSGRIRHHRYRDAGRHHPGAVVLHRIWTVDGLRGVYGFAHPRVLVDVRTPQGRQQ